MTPTRAVPRGLLVVPLHLRLAADAAAGHGPIHEQGSALMSLDLYTIEL